MVYVRKPRTNPTDQGLTSLSKPSRTPKVHNFEAEPEEFSSRIELFHGLDPFGFVVLPLDMQCATPDTLFKSF